MYAKSLKITLEMQSFGRKNNQIPTALNNSIKYYLDIKVIQQFSI